MSDESVKFALGKAEAEVERLTKLTDYLRNGEIDIDEQEREFSELLTEAEQLRAELSGLRSMLEEALAERDAGLKRESALEDELRRRPSPRRDQR